MNAREWLNGIDEYWGCWFAGFVDGEGCFSISSQAKGGYRCSFLIKLRADDGPLLKKIRGRLGMGTISTAPRAEPDKPQLVYSVQRKKDCLLLCDFFERFLLQSKKRRDFTIWAKAVDSWQTVQLGPGHGTSQWTVIAEAHEELREIRQYRELAA
jgi:hypothetical protein